jgi:hypothetical protein
MRTVWRSLFLAVGIMLIILGIECLLIDSATVYAAGEASSTDLLDPSATPAKVKKVVKPSEWMPWSLLSCGGIVILYAITLPQRWNSGGGQ